MERQYTYLETHTTTSRPISANTNDEQNSDRLELFIFSIFATILPTPVWIIPFTLWCAKKSTKIYCSVREELLQIIELGLFLEADLIVF